MAEEEGSQCRLCGQEFGAVDTAAWRAQRMDLDLQIPTVQTLVARYIPCHFVTDTDYTVYTIDYRVHTIPYFTHTV